MSYIPRRRPRHEELTVRGLTHRLTCWGEQSATPLILLHGWMDTSETWQFVVDCLPDTWFCIAPDWRGFGGTEHAKDGYWFPDYLADLEAILDSVAPRGRARIAGHSMGGNIACMYAGIRPERLTWLANLEGLGLPRVSAELAPLRYAQWLDEIRSPPRQRYYESVGQLAMLLQMRNPRLSEAKAEFIARAWSKPAPEGRVELAADPFHRMVNPVLYRREELEACWRRIEIPVLLLSGELSEHRKRLGADGTDEYLRSMFQNLRIATLEGAGHMFHHEEPQAVAQYLIEFANACEERLDARR